MELQKALPELNAGGVAVFAVRYAAVDVLAGFADKHGITFPLLSDEGSLAMRELGLLNQHVAEQHAFYGVRYATSIMACRIQAPSCWTKAAWSRPSTSSRATACAQRLRCCANSRSAVGTTMRPAFVGRTLISRSGVGRQSDVSPVSAAAPARAYRYSTGTHVLDAPLSVEVEPMNGLTVGATRTSAGHPFRVPGLDEELSVHSERAQVTVPLLITKNLGATELQARVTYQSCTATVCDPPRTVGLTLALQGQDLIRA